VIPLMTVVNYSVQDTLRQQPVFFWEGAGMVRAGAELGPVPPGFWDALMRNLAFSLIILSIEIPLGIFIALNMPRAVIWVPVCLVLMAHTAAYSLARRGHHLATCLRCRRSGFSGGCLNAA
jgi:glycerol transport system permease protein